MKTGKHAPKYSLLGIIIAGTLYLQATSKAQVLFYGFESPDVVGTTPTGYTAFGDTSTEGVSNTLAYQGTQSLNLNTLNTGYAVNINGGVLVAQGSVDLYFNYNSAMYAQGFSFWSNTGADYSNAGTILATFYGGYGPNAFVYDANSNAFGTDWAGAAGTDTWQHLTISWDASTELFTYSLAGGSTYTESMGTLPGVASFLFYTAGATNTGAEEYVDNVTTTAAPEPATWMMVAFGLSTVLIARRRRLC